jgi:nitrite reductase/ring-hydroxylating ferredoxin subunit
MSGIRTLGRGLSGLPEQLPPELRGPDWIQANPVLIQDHLDRALALASGGWFAIDASSAIEVGPRAYRVAGRELVAWRVGGALRIAPDACPHMGARLSDGHVNDGRLVCPWHGLELADGKHGAWCPLEAHDDGVLAWVQLPEKGQEPTPRPIVSDRPGVFLDSVMRMEAACEPRDVIANRLDPWHGVHYHPHTFKRLRVIGIREDRLVVRVVYGLSDRLGIEVDATFHCPDPRTITMTIVDGEGTGSVVETHATPVEPGRTLILEATLATSDRPGFQKALKAAGLIRPFILKAQRRLWTEDAAYAERTYALRKSASGAAST